MKIRPSQGPLTLPLPVTPTMPQQQQQRGGKRYLTMTEIRARQHLINTLANPDDENWSVPSSPPPFPTSCRGLSGAQLAVGYRRLAREVKHAADARLSNDDEEEHHRRRTTRDYNPLAALQHLDATLLFAHAFHLDDLAHLDSTNPGPQRHAGVAAGGKNWTSILPLLSYVSAQYIVAMKQNPTTTTPGVLVLLGVCRVLESAVLRKLHTHNTQLLLLQSAETTVPPDSIASLAAELDKSDRANAHARSLIRLPTLARHYPHTYNAVLTNPGDADPDPSNITSCQNSLVWPLDATSPIPHIVAFARSLIHEYATRHNLPYTIPDPSATAPIIALAPPSISSTRTRFRS